MNRLHEVGSAVKVLESRLHWLLHTTCLGRALPPNLHGGLTWPGVPLHARRALEKEGSSDQAWMLRNVLCFLLSTKFEASVRLLATYFQDGIPYCKAAAGLICLQ